MSEDTNVQSIEDFMRYLEPKYNDPTLWAIDISNFFKQLAAHMKKFPRLEERADGVRSFKRVIQALRDLSTERYLNEKIGELAGVSRSDTEEAVADDTASYNFVAKTAYTVCINEDPPASVIDSLALKGNGPVTVTIRVQKEADATSGVSDGGDAKPEGSESLF
ncbi:hypothetical protein QBC45DRAFT_339214 [Copromyces sp. CBS 386.78]|nr:hypothetical protein QBC45DRAFT_339214 [Copromyces sp. CBS 386.78]